MYELYMLHVVISCYIRNEIQKLVKFALHLTWQHGNLRKLCKYIGIHVKYVDR